MRSCPSGSCSCASKPAEIISRSGLNVAHRRNHRSAYLRSISSSLAPASSGMLSVKPTPFAPAGLARGAGARIERELVRRHEQHRRILVEDPLRAVAVMHVVVDDRDAGAAARARVGRADGDVVVETEAHRAIGFGVMARRAHQRQRARSCRRRRARDRRRSAPRPRPGGRSRPSPAT